MRKIALMLLLLLMISGCSGAAKTPVTSPTAVKAPAGLPVDASRGYPAVPTASDQGGNYPAPQTNTGTNEEPTSTPAANMGRVSGTLLYKGKPVANTHLYLGAFLKNNQGVEFTAALDPSSSPSAYTDNQGSFTFINVPPGRYGLIIDNVVNSYLLYKPGTQESFAVDVTPGGMVDIGKQDFDELPIPDGTQNK